MQGEPENRIRRKLRRTATALRFIGTLRCLISIVLVFSIYLFAVELVDSYLVLSRKWRALLLVTGLGVPLGMEFFRLVSLWTKRIPMRQIAAIYERNDPDLAEALLSAVTTNVSEEPGELHAAFVHETYCQADCRLAQIPVRFLFNWMYIARLAVTTALCASGLALFFLNEPGRAGLAFSRIICVSNEKRTSRTLLWLQDQPCNKIYVRRGDPFELIVCSDSNATRVAQRIAIQCRYDDGTNESFSVTRSRDELVKRNERSVNARVFRVSFPRVLRSFEATITGGDSQCTCRVIATVPPAIISTHVLQLFPAYMHRPPTEEESNGMHVVPEGTSLQFRFQTDRPAQRIVLMPENCGEVQRGPNDSSFTLLLQPVRQSVRFQVELVDEHEIAAKDPPSIHIDVLPDLPPVITASTPGIGRRITPNALIPWKASIKDDFGINAIYLGSRKDKNSEFVPMRLSTAEKLNDIALPNGIFDASCLPLKPGDRLTLRLEASDFKEIPTAENEHRYQTGYGPVWEFEVVEPDRLKELLEAQEYAWRDRLANLVREMEQTKESLASHGNRARISRDLQKQSYDTRLIARGIASLCEEIEHNRLVGSHYVSSFLTELQKSVAQPLESLADSELASLQRQLSSSEKTNSELNNDEKGNSLAALNRALNVLNNALIHMRSLQSLQSLIDEFKAVRKELLRKKIETEKRKNDLFLELEKE